MTARTPPTAVSEEHEYGTAIAADCLALCHGDEIEAQAMALRLLFDRQADGRFDAVQLHQYVGGMAARFGATRFGATR